MCLRVSLARNTARVGPDGGAVAVRTVAFRRTDLLLSSHLDGDHVTNSPLPRAATESKETRRVACFVDFATRLPWPAARGAYAAPNVR